MARLRYVRSILIAEIVMTGKGIKGSPTYSSPSLLVEKISEYFAMIEEKKAVATISGLCLHCGFSSRQSFYDYEKKADFSYTIKRARLSIETIYESRLHGNSPTGAIFALKNFGWIDKSEVEHTGEKEQTKIFIIRDTVKQTKDEGVKIGGREVLLDSKAG